MVAADFAWHVGARGTAAWSVSISIGSPNIGRLAAGMLLKWFYVSFTCCQRTAKLKFGDLLAREQRLQEPQHVIRGHARHFGRFGPLVLEVFCKWWMLLFEWLPHLWGRWEVFDYLEHSVEVDVQVVIAHTILRPR